MNSNSHSHDNNEEHKYNKIKRTNAYIDIDNVLEEPGADFENWIKITKAKLRERESKLMTVRIETLQNIIKQQVEIFINDNSIQNKVSVTVCNYDDIVTDELIEACLNKLFLSLTLWNGVNLTKTKKSLATFRKYFVIGKCWFDQKKKTILAPEFWIKFFHLLNDFTNEAGRIYFNDRFDKLQKLYSKALLFQIVEAIFCSELHFAATKPQPLIPCGILKDSRPMKQYLVTYLDETLNTDYLVKQKNGKRIHAKDVLQIFSKQLHSLTVAHQHEFKHNFHALWDQVNLSPVDDAVVAPAAQVQLPTVNTTYSGSSSVASNSSTLTTSGSAQIPIIPMPVIHDNSSYCSGDNLSYGATHGSSHSVVNQRFNPMIGTGHHHHYHHGYNYNNNQNANTSQCPVHFHQPQQPQPQQQQQQQPINGYIQQQSPNEQVEYPQQAQLQYADYSTPQPQHHHNHNHYHQVNNFMNDNDNNNMNINNNDNDSNYSNYPYPQYYHDHNSVNNDNTNFSCYSTYSDNQIRCNSPPSSMPSIWY